MKLCSTAPMMTLAIALTAACHTAGHAQGGCTEFRRLVAKTYDFDATRLSGRQKMAKEKALTGFWNTVKAKKRAYLPCLRTAVADPKSKPFFRFDGSNLLVELDPSTASKALQVGIYTTANFDIIGGRRWLSILSSRGTEGFDVSKAAERWMGDSKPYYTLPEHGDFPVTAFEGAFFLYGSMSEAQATPALLRIVNQAGNPHREIALWLLMSQATPEALKALSHVSTEGLSDDVVNNLEALLSHPRLIERRSKPRTSRAEFLRAFQELLQGNAKRFFALSDKVEDGEKDVAAVMKPEDVPLLRRVRRRFAAGGNPHTMDYYNDFTGIIMTLIWKPSLVQPNTSPDVTVL